MAELNLGLYLAAENPHGLQWIGGQLARYAVRHTQRSNRVSIACERRTGVEANFWIEHDQGILGKAVVLCSIWNDKQIGIMNGPWAERDIPRRFRSRHSRPGFQPLPVRVHRLFSVSYFFRL
jgi:hypothetical protein